MPRDAVSRTAHVGTVGKSIQNLSLLVKRIVLFSYDVLILIINSYLSNSRIQCNNIIIWNSKKSVVIENKC